MSVITWDFTNAPIVDKTPKIITWNAEAFANPITKPSFDGWSGTITSEYGWRVLFGEKEFHRGVDIAMPLGTPLDANISGTVIASGGAVPQGYHEGYGNLVVIKDKIGQEHIYGHLDSVSVKVGDKVNIGDHIGNIGTTGRSTGSHLHYEINWNGQSIDPLKYVLNAKDGESYLYPLTKNFNTKEELNAITQDDISSGNGIVDFMDFINTVRTDGLSMALFNKPFDQVILDSLTTVLKSIGVFITGNSDLFFLLPAIAFLFITFMVGTNRFTKWIIPLLITYVCSRTIYFWLI